MITVKTRNILITLFVICWTILFHYESTRTFYLESFFKHDLPKFKFLFPPAGWIMFFNVDEQFSRTQVYGLKSLPQNPNQYVPQEIEPHVIFRTRTIGFDNIHRNIMSTVIMEMNQRPFCRYLKMKFPYYDNFVVILVRYPNVVKTPMEHTQQVVYQCF